MGELQVSFKKAVAEEKLTVTWGARAAVVDYSTDVDFTLFVEQLSESIGQNEPLAISEYAGEQLTPKGGLVLETIKQIISKFNEVMADDGPSGDDGEFDPGADQGSL